MGAQACVFMVSLFKGVPLLVTPASDLSSSGAVLKANGHGRCTRGVSAPTNDFTRSAFPSDWTGTFEVRLKNLGDTVTAGVGVHVTARKIPFT